MNLLILNNREIAGILWLVIVLVLVTFSSKFDEIKEAIIIFLKHFVSPQILKLLFVIVGYFLLTSYTIYSLTDFNLNQVKNMCVWFFLVGMFPLTKYEKLSTDRDSTLKQVLKESIMLTVLVEFLVSAFPFSFLTEFVFVIPITAILGAVLGYTANGRDSITYNFTLKISSLVGIFFILHSVYEVYYAYNKLDYTQLSYDFSTPIIATILYTPFLYLFATYLVYERCLSSFQFRVKQSDLFAIKRYALLTFRTDIQLLERWSREIYGNMDLEEATQKGNQIKEIKRLETAPPPVRKDYGWSPYLAIDFLEELDFKTNGYHEIFGEWGASSSPVLLGKKELFQNKLGYYVYGSKLIAKTLRVVLNVNVPNEIDSALNSFVLASSILYEKATSMPLPSKFKHNIFNETIFEVKQGSYVIKLYKEEWENSKGYDLRFSIQIKEL